MWFRFIPFFSLCRSISSDLIWLRLIPLGFMWVHLSSHDFMWFDFTSFDFAWFFSQGKRDLTNEKGKPKWEKGKGKVRRTTFLLHFPMALHRAHAQTKRNNFPVTGGPTLRRTHSPQPPRYIYIIYICFRLQASGPPHRGGVGCRGRGIQAFPKESQILDASESVASGWGSKMPLEWL